MSNLETSNEATSTKSNESMLKIYCDMDGVLTDFISNLAKFTLGVLKSLLKKTVKMSFGNLLMAVE